MASGDAIPTLAYDRRRRRLQEGLRRRRLDGLLVSQPDNRRYLSGFTATDHGVGESSGVLFVPARGETVLLTDFRYVEQAGNETSLTVMRYPKGLPALLEDLLGAHAIGRFGFESHATLHSFSVKLAELAARKGIELVPVSGLVERQRVIKSGAELELIRQSVRLNEAVFAAFLTDLEPGLTEIDAAVAIEARMRRAGADRPSFDTIVAAGENGALPHAVPGPRRIMENEAVTIDMGLTLHGYCSDMTRSFVLGSAGEDYRRIHRLVRQAQREAIATVRPGVLMQQVDRAARRVIAAAGHGRHFGHALGHGVGLAVHERPGVSARNRQKLRPGMVITVEPGIYIPGWGGIRLENMVAVSEDGHELLNTDTTWLDL